MKKQKSLRDKRQFAKTLVGTPNGDKVVTPALGAKIFMPANQKYIKQERLKASKLKKTTWWKQKLQKGKCFYCEKIFKPQELSMEHLTPLVRGGLTVKNNIVLSCKKCNFEKKHQMVKCYLT